MILNSTMKAACLAEFQRFLLKEIVSLAAFLPDFDMTAIANFAIMQRMKTRFSGTLAVAIATLASSTAFALPISRCTVSVYDKDSGAELSSGIRYLRENAVDSIYPSFQVKLTEERTSPDSFGYGVTASSLPAGAFFNPQISDALGGTFGNSKIFGIARCELPEEHAFYYRAADGTISIDDHPEHLQQTVLTQGENGACIGGDLNAAAQDLHRYWYLSIKDLSVDGDVLRWTEEKVKCTKWQPTGDLPSGGNCLEYKVISTTARSISQCR